MSATPRRTRSDALQNRERLLEVAARVFAEMGMDTAPAAIAKEAGVGVGTLYRHFPTRETLLVAAHHRQLALVCETATALAARHTAAEATRLWLEHFLDYAMASSDMCTAMIRFQSVTRSAVSQLLTLCPSPPSAPGRLRP